MSHSANAYFRGPSWSVEYAKKSLPVLVSLADRKQKITYKGLASMLADKSYALTIPNALGILGQALAALAKAEGKKFGKIPPIQLLVCNERTGRPGDAGLDFVGIKRSQASRMPKKALDAIVRDTHRKIFDFEHWPKVLKLLGLKPTTLPLPPTEELLTKFKKTEQHPTGEGDEHKLLKLFLAENPRRIGIPWKGKGITEERVLSGDRLDISFRDNETWICVEVKGRHAPDFELIRGMFQCVKYRAALEAQLRYEALQGQEQEKKISPRALLACGARLSKELRELAEFLEVEVRTGIEVPDDFTP